MPILLSNMIVFFYFCKLCRNLNVSECCYSCLTPKMMTLRHWANWLLTKENRAFLLMTTLCNGGPAGHLHIRTWRLLRLDTWAHQQPLSHVKDSSLWPETLLRRRGRLYCQKTSRSLSAWRAGRLILTACRNRNYKMFSHAVNMCFSWCF